LEDSGFSTIAVHQDSSIFFRLNRTKNDETMKIRLPKRYAKFEQFLLAMVDGLKRRGSDFASAAAFDSF